MWRWISLLGLASLSCGGASTEGEFAEVVPGPPVAGAAEGHLVLPVGSPMGGYSSRCGYLGAASEQDDRDSAYTVNWDESTGVHMLPGLKVVWLGNGDQQLVLVKADVIYAFDGMVEELEQRISDATGVDVRDQVVFTANHSHASFSNFSDQVHFYLGGDRYNEEVFTRFAEQATELAVEAHAGLQPVAIGTSWTRDWDPEDRVYRDRRPDNDELVVWPDAEPGMGKDPYAHLVRIDTLEGEPLAVLVTFGIHGTLLSDGQSLISGDAPAAVELGLQEQFDDRVVVLHLQGAGGDASPVGVDEDYARVESIGEIAGPMLAGIWERTPTSSDPIRLETATRHIPEYLTEIEVTRDGAVDWRYPEPDPELVPDERIYAEDGSLLSPLDEFNAPSGAAFCGSDEPLIPAGGIGSYTFPYDTCMDVELVSRILLGVFGLEESDVGLPLPESLDAGTAATRIGPLLTMDEDGVEVSRDLLVGFFPAEPTAMFSEQWRRRARAELGYEMALLVGYSQDHEGYFLIPEDWLMGGYEPNINLWGPLQGEHVMEGVLDYAGAVLGTDIVEGAAPLGLLEPTTYPDRPLPELEPDQTPGAGEVLTELPDYMWLPLDGTRDVANGVEGRLELEPPAELPRVQGIAQLAWSGGDPGVDLPVVSLERETAAGWEVVHTGSGRPIDTSMPDILLAHTPDPLYPFEEAQEHLWWAGWQAVAHRGDRAGLELGTYRLRVDGQRYVGGASTWPWPTEAYELHSAPFELVPAELMVAVEEGGIYASIDAPPGGWRLIDLEGSSQGSNPAAAPLKAEALDATDEVVQSWEELDCPVVEGRCELQLQLPEEAHRLRITDAWSNSGWVELGAE